MTDEMVRYATPNAPAFKIHLAGKLYEAKNKVLELPPHAAAEMESMIKEHDRYDIAANVRKLTSMGEAEAIAKAHMASVGKKPQATKGLFSSATGPKPPTVPTGDGQFHELKVPSPDGASEQAKQIIEQNRDHMLAAANPANAVDAAPVNKHEGGSFASRFSNKS